MLTREETWKRLVDTKTMHGDISPLPWAISRPVWDGERYWSRAVLTKALLQNKDLSNTNLGGSDLNQSICTGTNFENANLTNCNFQDADFSHAVMRNVDLRGADLRGAIFTNTDLSGANLSGALLQKSSMIGTNLSNSNLNNCNIFGISTWNLITNDNTSMRDLIISQEDEQLLTVDDIEVAQFIHMIRHNRSLSKVIDTMRTKAILILGSFDNESKVVLEALKEAVRNNGFLPIIFDFVAPRSQELMETVRTMALLSRCVIVDLTVRSGQLHELAGLVPTTYTPFVTIAQEGTRCSLMQDEFKHHYWYMSQHIAYTRETVTNEISKILTTSILPWVEATTERIQSTRKMA